MEYIVWGVVDWMRAATMSLISLYSSGEVTKPETTNQILACIVSTNQKRVFTWSAHPD